MAVKQQQGAAVALIEVSEAADRLESIESVDSAILETAPQEIREFIRRVLQETAETARELRSTRETLIEDADASPGVRVSTASAMLEVSEPTIRDWIRRDILVAVEPSKPLQVEIQSLMQVRRVLRDLRRRATDDSEWRQNLVDSIHDAVTLKSPSVRTGIEEFEAGELGQEL